jgi:hypothetical protein
MAAVTRLAGLVMSLGVTACGSSIDSISGAADISPSLVSQDAQNAAQTSGQKRQYLGLVVGDSEDKCKAFAQALIGSETGFNTTSDVLTTVATALGTAFTPLATVHAFTAAGSIVSGSKTAVNANVWAKQPITNLLAAIGNKYYVPMAAYRTDLENTAETSPNLVVSTEVARIKSIHQACNLASAQTAIQAKVEQPPGGAGEQPAPPGVPGPPAVGPAAAPIVPALPGAAREAPRRAENPYGTW